MEKKSDTGTVGIAYGVKLDTPISFDYSWTAYETPEELVAAKDEMTLDEQVKARNTARQNNARNKAQVAQLKAAGYEKPTLDTSETLRLKTIYDALIASKKYTEEAAKALAAKTLGLDAWPE